jgi:hypothetical protein
MTSPAGTNRNTGSRSMNRLINHGHAIRSTRAFSRVTHFICSLPSLAKQKTQTKPGSGVRQGRQNRLAVSRATSAGVNPMSRSR